MKYILIFLLSTALNASCQNKASKGDDLARNITRVIKAFKDKDAKTLNSMIHKDHGLTVVFRSGVFDEYKTTDKIDFNNPVPNWPYPDFKPELDLKYETLPTFDCGSDEWSKKGLYCNTLKKDHLLSRTALNLIKYADIEVEQEVIDAFKELEDKSHRVVMVDADGKSLIFYLTQIKNKWYLTAIDRVSGDCSA